MYYIKNLWIILFFMAYPSYGSYVFISSTPTDAKVSMLTENNKLKVLGRTPLRLTNFSKSTKIVLEKAEYYNQTNTISSSKKVQSFNYTLKAFSFDIQVLDQTRESTIKANGKIYANLDDPLRLPYGNYSFSQNKNHLLEMEYRSPYTPYIAFFSTVTVLSTIFAVTGGVLANQAFQDFNRAENTDQLLSALSRVSTWDTVTWSSVGIGTGALLGTIITASLDAKDKKRIKRFNGMNSPSSTSKYYSEFQEILVLSTRTNSNALNKMNSFIRKYSKTNTTFIPEVYMRRAMLLYQQKKYRASIKDLDILIKEYPSKSNYELASKLLADNYMALKNYRKALEYFDEAIKVMNAYTLNDIQKGRLEALYQLAKKNKAMREEFLNINFKELSKELKEQIQKQQMEFQ